MMFTEKAMKAAEEKFSRLLEKAGEKKREEILSRLAQAEKTESADHNAVGSQETEHADLVAH